MNRRSFMQAILAAGVAPYVCTTSGVLMPVRAIAEPSLVVLSDARMVEALEYFGPELLRESISIEAMVKADLAQYLLESTDRLMSYDGDS